MIIIHTPPAAVSGSLNIGARAKAIDRTKKENTRSVKIMPKMASIEEYIIGFHPNKDKMITPMKNCMKINNMLEIMLERIIS